MMAKLYWRVKRNGKWTWRSAGKLIECHESTWLPGGEVSLVLNGTLPECEAWEEEE
jgi:hypothetical protein